MDHTDRQQATPAAPRARSHRWIAPVLGAVVGLLLGTALVSLAAAVIPEGSPAFTEMGLTFQVVGALLGLFVGGLLARRPA